MQQAQNRKLPPFGSIWWLLDSKIQDNWNRKHGFGFCPRPGLHARHPTLVIANNPRAGAAEKVPTLFGQSEPQRGAFVVRGIASGYPSNYATHFHDALFPLDPKIYTSVDPRSGQRVAEVDTYCTELDASEKAKLQDWLRARVRRPRRWHN